MYKNDVAKEMLRRLSNSFQTIKKRNSFSFPQMEASAAGARLYTLLLPVGLWWDMVRLSCFLVTSPGDQLVPQRNCR